MWIICNYVIGFQGEGRRAVALSLSERLSATPSLSPSHAIGLTKLARPKLRRAKNIDVLLLLLFLIAARSCATASSAWPRGH